MADVHTMDEQGADTKTGSCDIPRGQRQELKTPRTSFQSCHHANRAIMPICITNLRARRDSEE
jgi:hypothetical protein